MAILYVRKVVDKRTLLSDSVFIWRRLSYTFSTCEYLSIILFDSLRTIQFCLAPFKYRTYFPHFIFFYRFVRDSFTKEIAIVSTIILQTSFYLANFFKIGYDNPQSFTLFILCFYLLKRFSESPTKKLAILVGLTFGVSFYIYMGPIFPLFLWPYFLPLCKSLRTKKFRRSFVWLLASYLLILLPVFINLTTLSPVIGAFGASQNFHLDSLIFKNFLLFYKNNDYFYNHFVTGPYLDSISGLFCLLGSFIVLFKNDKKPYLFLLLSYVTTTIVIGATSPEDFSPITRGIFLLPYGFIFAGVGLTSFVGIFGSKSFSTVCKLVHIICNCYS
jgi:dolichyl-phosphate-mannose-protein mannosyltransferase